MDGAEMAKLFALLQELYPNTAKFRTVNTKAAWKLMLEPFPYEDIRAAALAFARENKYPPDPGDLCRGLVQQKSERPCARAGEAWQQAIDAGRAKDAAEELGSVSRYAREHGITWQEAKEALSNDE